MEAKILNNALIQIISDMESDKINIEDFAKHTIELRYVAQHTSGPVKEYGTIILNVLETPWGAPFVSMLSLHAAAEEYMHTGGSSLELFAKAIPKYIKSNEFSLLNELKILQEELNSLDEKAA